MLGVLAHLDHARRQDALRAIEGGKGLGQAGHLAADGRLALHQHDFVAAVGDIQRRLNSGNAATDHQRPPGDGNSDRNQRVVVAHLLHRHAHQFGRFRSGLFAIRMHPGAMLADVGHLHQVGIDAGAFSGLAESLQVHVRGAGGHHDAVEPFAGNLFAQQRLAGIGAHVLVIQRATHARNLRQRVPLPWPHRPCGRCSRRTSKGRRLCGPRDLHEMTVDTQFLWRETHRQADQVGKIVDRHGRRSVTP